MMAMSRTTRRPRSEAAAAGAVDGMRRWRSRVRPAGVVAHHPA